MAGATLNWCCFCVRHTTMQQFTVSLYSKPHYAALHVCLAVMCHLHFWQNDRDLLHATAITQGWKRHQNKSRHRKLTLEKKILLSLQWELVTFCLWVLHSAHWAITTPHSVFLCKFLSSKSQRGWHGCLVERNLQVSYPYSINSYTTEVFSVCFKWAS